MVTTLIAGGSLIQGSFPGVPHPEGGLARNLEAVILLPRAGGLFDLRHHWRDQVVPDRPWQFGSVVTKVATGPGAICQRRDLGTTLGNFEVLVPEAEGLAHYWLDNSISGPRGWDRVGIVAPRSTGLAAVLENRVNGNLEAVACAGSSLTHYWFDRTAWRPFGVITDRATGAPAMIQSDYDDHLEVIVPEGPNLVLYWLDWTGVPKWRPGGLITNAGDGPAGFVQGRYGADPHRNFEVVVPRGDTLGLYWRDDTLATMPWRPGGVATWGAGPVLATALCSSELGDGWLSALTQEGTSLYQVYRYPVDGGLRWMRSACIHLDDTSPTDSDPNHPRSTKLAQVTGEPDAQTKGATLSTSRTRSGILGTDLGVSVEHGGRTFLLFGDTHWDDPNRKTLDSIAEVRSPGDELPEVTLHGSPVQIDGGAVTDREYDVPLDAVSAAGQFFLLYSSDHFTHGKVMGRSVLARAVDPSMPIDGTARNSPLEFRFLATFSDFRFINTSVQLRPAASVPGFGGDGDVLLVWGSGAYRADDLRLAVLDLRDPSVWSYLLGDEPFAIGALGVRYFTGLCGTAALWSSREEDARPVLFPCALGELSVRWVPAIERYVLLAMSGFDDPIGAAVWMRTAPHPWGPWSRRRQVFDWIVDGMGIRDPSKQFIHNNDAVPPDSVGECIFEPQCSSGGAAYAPYLFDARLDGGSLILRYTLSTWNPYQAMLMRHEVTLGELSALESR